MCQKHGAYGTCMVDDCGKKALHTRLCFLHNKVDLNGKKLTAQASSSRGRARGRSGIRGRRRGNQSETPSPTSKQEGHSGADDVGDITRPTPRYDGAVPCHVPRVVANGERSAGVIVWATQKGFAAWPARVHVAPGTTKEWMREDVQPDGDDLARMSAGNSSRRSSSDVGVGVDGGVDGDVFIHVKYFGKKKQRAWLSVDCLEGWESLNAAKYQTPPSKRAMRANFLVAMEQARAAASAPKNPHCFCRTPWRGRHMAACDACGMWCHARCVGIVQPCDNVEHARVRGPFTCDTCVQGEAAAPPPPLSEAPHALAKVQSRRLFAGAMAGESAATTATATRVRVERGARRATGGSSSGGGGGGGGGGSFKRSSRSGQVRKRKTLRKKPKPRGAKSAGASARADGGRIPMSDTDAAAILGSLLQTQAHPATTHSSTTHPSTAGAALLSIAMHRGAGAGAGAGAGSMRSGTVVVDNEGTTTAADFSAGDSSCILAPCAPTTGTTSTAALSLMASAAADLSTPLPTSLPPTTLAMQHTRTLTFTTATAMSSLSSAAGDAAAAALPYALTTPPLTPPLSPTSTASTPVRARLQSAAAAAEDGDGDGGGSSPLSWMLSAVSTPAPKRVKLEPGVAARDVLGALGPASKTAKVLASLKPGGGWTW